jgi:hypothetical protein
MKPVDSCQCCHGSDVRFAQRSSSPRVYIWSCAIGAPESHGMTKRRIVWSRLEGVVRTRAGSGFHIRDTHSPMEPLMCALRRLHRRGYILAEIQYRVDRTACSACALVTMRPLDCAMIGPGAGAPARYSVDLRQSPVFWRQSAHRQATIIALPLTVRYACGCKVELQRYLATVSTSWSYPRGCSGLQDSRLWFVAAPRASKASPSTGREYR